MCIDFTDLKKACTKNNFSFLKIKQLVDSKSGHRFMNFIDVFLGYKQICMLAIDEENIAFITNQELYFYLVMPFMLKMLALHTKY